MKRSGQARLVRVFDMNRNIPTTWMRASGDLKESNAKMIRIRDVTSRRPEKLVLGSLRPANGTEITSGRIRHSKTCHKQFDTRLVKCQVKSWLTVLDTAQTTICPPSLSKHPNNIWWNLQFRSTALLLRGDKYKAQWAHTMRLRAAILQQQADPPFRK